MTTSKPFDNISCEVLDWCFVRNKVFATELILWRKKNQVDESYIG